MTRPRPTPRGKSRNLEETFLSDLCIAIPQYVHAAIRKAHNKAYGRVKRWALDGRCIGGAAGKARELAEEGEREKFVEEAEKKAGDEAYQTEKNGKQSHRRQEAG